jgi:hypothetical protein
LRENIDPVSGSNFALMGDDEISASISYLEKRLVKDLSGREIERAEATLSVIRDEKAYRNKLKAVGCPWLTEGATCRHRTVSSKNGKDHECPRFSGGGCTLKKITLAAKFSRVV